MWGGVRDGKPHTAFPLACCHAAILLIRSFIIQLYVAPQPSGPYLSFSGFDSCWEIISIPRTAYTERSEGQIWPCTQLSSTFFFFDLFLFFIMISVLLILFHYILVSIFKFAVLSHAGIKQSSEWFFSHTWRGPTNFWQHKKLYKVFSYISQQYSQGKRNLPGLLLSFSHDTLK